MPTTSKSKSKGGGEDMFPKKPADVLKLIKDNNIEFIDLRFLDFIGTWQHFSVPAHELSAGTFEDGLGFDGSSIRGWQSIHASDMLMIPDPETSRIDPFMTHPTLAIICDIVDPITREPYSRDPRNIAKKAISYLKSTGIGDMAFFGPELEFFRLRRRKIRPDFELRLLLRRFHGRHMELRQGREPQPRLQAEAQGRLLSDAADRLAPGHALRDGEHTRKARRKYRSPSPRSGNGRTVRNRHALFPVDSDG